MMKKFIFFLIVLAGVMLLYLRPVTFDKGLGRVLPTGADQENFGNFQEFERQDQLFIVLTQERGDIFNPVFLKTLRDVTEEIFYLPGVDRMHVLSLPNIDLTYRDVVEDGFEGGPIIPEDFSYGNEGYEQIKKNILKSPYVGQLVSYDFKSAMIVVPFLSDENNPWNNTQGLILIQAIKTFLPQNSQIHSSIFGYVPFTVALQKELAQSLFIFIAFWLTSCGVFLIYIRRLALSIFWGPWIAVLWQVVVYGFFSRSLHPFGFPVLVFVFILSFSERIWSELNSGNIEQQFSYGRVGAATLPATSFFFLGSELGKQMAILSLSGALALLITQMIFLNIKMRSVSHVKSTTPKDSMTVSFKTQMILWLILLLGLGGASTIFIGNKGSGPTILRQNTQYQRMQKGLSDHFAFTADSFLIPAVASPLTSGVTDPAIIQELDTISWSLSRFPGVRFVSSLAEVVKRLNMFFHENYLKWRSIPRNKDTLILATSQIDPRTGLLDDKGFVLPLTVVLENHHPETVRNIYRTVKKAQLSTNALILKIAGGTAAFEAILNHFFASSVKYLLLIFFGVALIVARLSLSASRTISFGFYLAALLSLALGLLACLRIGLNLDSITGLILSSCLGSYCLWLRGRYPARDKKITVMIFVLCLFMAGGLFSGVNVIFHMAWLSEVMLISTGLLGIKLVRSERDVPGPRAKI